MDQRARVRDVLTFLAGALSTTPAAPLVLVLLGVEPRPGHRAGILVGSGPLLTLILVVAAVSASAPTAVLVAAAMVGLVVVADRAVTSIGPDATALASGFAVGLSVVGAVALLQVFGGGADRAWGFSPHPNVLGGTVAPLLLFSSGILVRVVGRRGAVVVVAGALLLGAAALAYAGSRGAYLGAAVGALVLLRTSVPRGRGRIVSSAITAVAATTLLLVPAVRAPIVTRLLEVSDASDASGRAYVWALTLEAVALRPFLGHGWGGFTQAIESVEPAFRTDRTIHAHSLYLQLLVDGGWLTLLAFGYWWLRLLRGLIRRSVTDPSVAGPALAAVVCVAVHGLFEPLLYHGSIAASTLLIVGIGLGPSGIAKAPDPSAGVARVDVAG